MIARTPEAYPGVDPLLELSATELIDALKAGDLTASSYARLALRRAEALESLNIFVTLDHDQVMESAHAADTLRASGQTLAALHGLPVTLKDLVNTSFLPTSAGTPALSGNNPKTGNARIVDILIGAGAVPFGKANMHELSFGATSVNPFTGAVGNPYNPAMIAGGSSGGPAAAPAGRIVPVGIGGDTAGSVRIPASLCGVCGLRPTTGRWPGDPISLVPISNTRDTLGPLARSCADLELLDRVVTGSSRVSPADLRKVRLAVVPYFFSDLEPGVEKAAKESLAALKEAGVTLVETDAELIDLTTGSFDIMLFELIQNLTLYLNANTDGPLGLGELVSQVQSPDVKGLVKSLMPKFGGKRVEESAYRAALNQREQLRAAYAGLFAESGCDAMVFPATVQPTTPIRDPAPITTYIHNTDAGSMAGIPGTAQPIGLSEGLPVSLALDGPVDSDRHLLSIAMALEDEVFGRLKPPSL